MRAYTEAPVSLPWNPAGAVHSSVSRNGVVYLGGKLRREGLLRRTLPPEHLSGARRQNVVNASVVAAVFVSNGQIDTSWTPRIYETYPGCWTITSTPGKLWVVQLLG